jgi:hypothetical protein
MSEVLPPKRQAAVDRLRRRVEVYTKDHQDRFMHYERIGPALCEQQMQESFALKQKYLDPKAKKTSSNSKSNKSSSSSSGGINNNSTTNTGGGPSSTERTKPATETHAGNTQSVRNKPPKSFFFLFFYYYPYHRSLDSLCDAPVRSCSLSLCVCVVPTSWIIDSRYPFRTPYYTTTAPLG